MSSTTDDLGNPKVELSDGSALFALPHDPSLASASLLADIGKKTDSATHRTPDPTGDDQSLDPHTEGGPLQRFTDIKSPLGMVGLESLAKDEDEVAKAIAARSDEIYRNEFPVIVPKFGSKCEECGAEFDDEDIEECDECGHDTLTAPDPAERREIDDLFERVNKEGQSMRQVGKITDEDHSRLGVMAWVLRWAYLTGPRRVDLDGVDDAQRVIDVTFKELVRGDPKRLVPVVDADGRLGGVWWTCPFHRSASVVGRQEYEEDGHTRCAECGCDLREVHYAELEGAAGKDLEKLYFEHEVVMHAGHIPQPHGLDGLSPVHLIWLEQAILHWMDVYAAEFFNPHSERTPNKFLIVHTANPDSFERQLDEAKDDAAENPYKSGIFYNQLDPGQQSNTEAQVIDVMGDEFLGQSTDLRKRYENHIRTVFGVSDVFDSELEDAGGLNNEGLQLEVTDRSIAAAQQDYSDGPYDELLRYLGYEDWSIKFVPPRQQDLSEQRQAVQLLREAAEIGLPARMENGEPVVGDGDAEAPAQPDMGGPGDDEGSGFDTPDDLDEAPPDADVEDEDPLGQLADEVRAYRAAYEGAVWADPDAAGQKQAGPEYGRDEDVPANVGNRIERAARQLSWNDTDGVPAKPLRDFFVRKLSQPQGWSVDSLADGLREEFGADAIGPDRRVNVARTKSAQVLSVANDMAIEDIAARLDDDPLVYWTGPLDDDTTDGCRELQQMTDPEHGGTPLPLAEFDDRKAAISREHFPDFKAHPGGPLHWQERHKKEVVLPSEVDGPDATAGGIPTASAAGDD